MRPKSIILLALALGCGLVAAIGVTQVISRDQEKPVQQSDTRSIIVAAADIAPGELIVPQMIRLEPWPKEKAPEDAVTQLDKVVGCRARDEICKGDPIRERKLLGQGFTRRTATDYIPKGYRVVGVKVDMISGGGLIQPGDRVDVVVYLPRNTQKGILESRTQTILQDIKVFAVDDTFKIDPAAHEEDSIQAKVIQLLVTPQQAETLVLAQQLGKVQLSMRPPGGEDVIQTTGKTPGELLGQTGIGNRDGETTLTDSSASGGIMDLLASMKAKAALATPPTAQPTPIGTWNIRVLAGPDMSDVMMEESTDPSGEHFWRIRGVGGTLPPEPQAAPPPTPPAAMPPAAEADDSANTVPAEPTE